MNVVIAGRSVFSGFASKSAGIAWLRIFGRGLSVYAPWKKPLFSERNRLRRFVCIGAWRIGWLSSGKGFGQVDEVRAS